MKVKQIVMEYVNQWLTEMLGDDVNKYSGRYAVIFAGETLLCVDPVFTSTQVMVFPDVQKSCGYNGGAYIFNSGLGFSILTCCRDLYNALSPHFDNHDAWVYAYNAGVIYDSPDARIQRMEAACQVSDKAYAWMNEMLGSELMAKYAGLWVDLSAGEGLYGVDPMRTNETMIFPDEKPSCGYNGGAGIFNSGQGFSVLSCSYDLYQLLNKHFEDHGAWVHCYNAGVWFDSGDSRIQKMERLCRN